MVLGLTPLPFSETEPSKAPTPTTDPSLEFISVNTPVIGEGTSKFTLSVSSSTIGSSASTESPAFFNHLAKWLKNAGDSVDADEPIVELETDKVNLEVPSPITGVLTEINSKDGSVVGVGALLGSVSENGSGVKPSTTKNEQVKKQEIEPNENNVIKLDPIKKEPKVFEETLKVEEQSEKPLVLSDEVVDQAPTINNTQSQTLSPAVRKIVAENKIDLATVQGSGKDGRVLKGDLISMMGANPKPSERKIQYGQEERIKMTRLRQTIAKRLKQAQENAFS